MAYLFFILATVALIARPTDFVPGLAGVQLYLMMFAVALPFAIRSLHNQVKFRTLVQQPANLCVLMMVVAVALSHASIGYVAGTVEGGWLMFKTACYYFLLVAVINSSDRLITFLRVVAFSAVVMTFFSIQDFQDFKATWDGHPDLMRVRDLDMTKIQAERELHHVVETHGYSETGDAIVIYRMCGFGIFQDPNDLALLIMLASVLCVYFATEGTFGIAKLLWLLPLAVLMYGFVQTGSRGGMLSFLAAGTAWLSVRYGGKVAIALAGMALCGLPLVAGRVANMDISGGSGQARVQLWSDGLAWMKTSRALFGIGEGQYEEVAFQVAHNSYIHAFVELGVFGGLWFVGCLFFPAYAFYEYKRRHIVVQHPDLARLAPYIAGILVGWATGLGTLSRCYTPSTYLVIGIAAAYINLAGFHRRRPTPIVRFDAISIQRWMLAGAMVLIGAFTFVKVFARYG